MPNFKPILLFSLYFAVGLFIVRDYGISIDEIYEHEISLSNYVYVMGKGMSASQSENVKNAANDAHNLITYHDRFYGTALQNVTVFIEHLFRFELPSRDVFLLRHFFTFLNYFIAGIFFYLILCRRFGNTFIPLLGALFYILYPRFFGESFYNIKDIMFFSWYVISTYFVLRWPESKGNSFLFSAAISLAIATNTRILGVSVLLLACVFAFAIGTRRKALMLAVLTFVCYIVITPFTWENPLKNTIDIFLHFLHFQPWDGTHFYMGEMITREVPWHYIPVWMGLTVPLLYIIMFFIGVAAIAVAGSKFLVGKFKLKKILREPLFFLLLLLAAVYLIIAVAQTKISDVKVTRNNRIENIQLPYSVDMPDNEIFIISLNLLVKDKSTAKFNIIPDNCLQGVSINGKKIPLDGIQGLCDWSKGAYFDFSEYIREGLNGIEFHVANSGGPGGLRIEIPYNGFDSFSLMHYIFALLLLLCFVLALSKLKFKVIAICQSVVPSRLFDVFFMALFFCTLLGYIGLHVNMYEGWRHAYGIYASFLYIAILGLERSFAFISGKRVAIRRGFACVIAACMIYLSVWITVNHPYQYVYFNIVGRQFAEENFVLDYWDVSFIDLIRDVLADDNRPEIRFAVNCCIASKPLIFTESEKKRVVWSDMENADYYIQDTRIPYNERVQPHGFTELTAITVDGMKISRLYKRVNP